MTNVWIEAPEEGHCTLHIGTTVLVTDLTTARPTQSPPLTVEFSTSRKTAQAGPRTAAPASADEAEGANSAGSTQEMG
jgi:hypothetical protein